MFPKYWRFRSSSNNVKSAVKCAVKCAANLQITRTISGMCVYCADILHCECVYSSHNKYMAPPSNVVQPPCGTVHIIDKHWLLIGGEPSLLSSHWLKGEPGSYHGVCTVIRLLYSLFLYNTGLGVTWSCADTQTDGNTNKHTDKKYIDKHTDRHKNTKWLKYLETQDMKTNGRPTNTNVAK